MANKVVIGTVRVTYHNSRPGNPHVDVIVGILEPDAERFMDEVRKCLDIAAERRRAGDSTPLERHVFILTAWRIRDQALGEQRQTYPLYPADVASVDFVDVIEVRR